MDVAAHRLDLVVRSATVMLSSMMASMDKVRLTTAVQMIIPVNAEGHVDEFEALGPLEARRRRRRAKSVSCALFYCRDLLITGAPRAVKAEVQSSTGSPSPSSRA